MSTEERTQLILADCQPGDMVRLLPIRGTGSPRNPAYLEPVPGMCPIPYMRVGESRESYGITYIDLFAKSEDPYNPAEILFGSYTPEHPVELFPLDAQVAWEKAEEV